jgi:hypothetical protein
MDYGTALCIVYRIPATHYSARRTPTAQEQQSESSGCLIPPDPGHAGERSLWCGTGVYRTQITVDASRRGERKGRRTHQKEEEARPLPPSCAHTITMPQEHNHDRCHDHAHDHDHDAVDLGPQDSLYPHIDRANVVALNASEPGETVIKPWDKRLDEAQVRLPSSRCSRTHTHPKSSPLSQTQTTRCSVLVSRPPNIDMTDFTAVGS